MSEELNALLESSVRSPEIDFVTKSRLEDVRLCSERDTWWMFIASVSDTDHPVLQQARTLILCDYLLKAGMEGQLFAVNAANRRAPTVLFNPNEDEDTGRATEHSAFLEADASLDPENLYRLLEENRNRCRFILVKAVGEPDVYISRAKFSVKNLLMEEPVQSIGFKNFFVSAH